MHDSENNRTIQAAWYLSFRVFRVCAFVRPKGAQWDLKVSLPQSQLQLLDSTQQQSVAMTKLQPFL